jgi:hypothetical protein
LEVRHPFVWSLSEGVLLAGVAWALLGGPSGLVWLIGWPIVRGGLAWYRARRQVVGWVTSKPLYRDRRSEGP